MIRLPPFSILAFLVVVVVASSASAMEPGDKCKLKTPLEITMNRAGGVIEESLDVGTVVELLSVSDQNGIARITSGDVKGNVAAVDLESACTGTLRTCTLSSAIIMYEQNRSDSKSWRVKPGADVSILKKGKTWAAVRVGDLQGFVKTDEVGPACAAKKAAPDSDDGNNTSEAPTTPAAQESVDRGDGPGVLFLPFGLDGAAPAGSADALAEALWERLSYYRPDAARLGADASARDKPWKDLVAASAKRAHGVETAYVIVGRLSIEAPSPDAPLEDKNLLQLAVVDSKSGHVLKGVRIRPTTKASDPWAEKVLADLLPAMATAPGAKVPTKADKLEVPAAPQPTPGSPPAKHTDATPTPPTPWFANGWGYAALAGTALFGAGSGVAGRLALDDNARANDTVQIDPRRATLRNGALGEAITADSLGVVAVGAGVTTIVVFATRAGLSD
jgi:hypothetical protein